MAGHAVPVYSGTVDAQVATNSYVLARTVPGDLEAWYEFCSAHCQAASSPGDEISPSLFALMCIGFEAKWPPVLRHSTQLASSDGLRGKVVTARKLYDHVLQLVTFADGKPWKSMHANMSYEQQACSVDLIALATRMRVISGRAEEGPPAKQRCTNGKKPMIAQLGLTQDAYYISSSSEAGEEKLQELLNSVAKARREALVGSIYGVTRCGIIVCWWRPAGGEVQYRFRRGGDRRG